LKERQASSDAITKLMESSANVTPSQTLGRPSGTGKKAVTVS
jgi:hypothetical protein